MKEKIVFFLPFIFLFSCVSPKQQIESKEYRINTGIEKEYFKTLGTDCNLRVKNLLEYSCQINGKGCSLLETLPESCLNLKVTNTILVENLKQKQKLCVPADLKGTTKDKIGNELYKKALEILERHYCL
jgi:hypothetical protein